MIRRILALLRMPSPIMLVPVDLDCRAVIDHAIVHGQWQSARYGAGAQLETHVSSLDLDQAIHRAVSQAIDVYGQHFPALQVTRDERYRVMRYEVGQEFPLHVDQNSVERQATRVLSIVIYLNDDFDGGHTVFPMQGIDVRPRAGYCLILPAGYAFPHASTPITRGTKFVVTTHLHVGPPWLSDVT